MAYNVSAAFREQCYSGESLYSCRLIIGGNTIPISQIASITISSPIIDSNSETFYIGTFISQQLTIQFKNLDGIDTTSGTNVDLYISQNVSGTDIEVPIGKYVIDESPENYYQSAKIVCLDYAIKFATNLDYSSALVDNKITIDNLLQWICNHYGVTLGSYPSINGNVEIGTYDSTVSGKRWISYIAEIKGCNAKMDRLGQLTLVPIKSSPAVTINALKSASWELGEKFEISQVTFFDAIRNYTYGDDSENTLFLRQDNPFIINTNVVQNVYNAVKDLQIWSLKCENYGDISLDAWDIIQYTLGNETYYTYNNNTITYAMTIMSKVETKIPTKQQEITTNVLGGDEQQQIRRLKTEVNTLDNEITIAAQQIETIEQDIQNPTSTKENKYFDIEDALDSPLIDFSLYGETYQEQTTQGKNLLPNNAYTQTIKGVTFTKNNDKSISIKGTATGDADLYLFGSWSSTTSVVSLASGNYTLSLSASSTLVNKGTLYIGYSGSIYKNTNSTNTFTVSGSQEISFAFIRIFTNQTVDLTLYPMLESGSSASEYEPYTNGASPNPNYPQDIHVVSGDNTIEIKNKNIWIPTLTNNGSNISCTNCSATLSNDEYSITATGSDMQFGQISPANNNYSNSLGTLYEVKNATSIGILLTNNLFVRNYITFYNSSKVSLGYTRIDSNSGSVNVPSGAVYFSWRVGILNSTSGTTYKTKIMVSYNETPTSYIEHQEQSQLISLGVENLLPNNNTTQTINGITFTKNDNGSITLSGTSNAVADYYLVGSASEYVNLGLSTGTYNLNGVINGSLSTYMLYAVVNRNGTLSYYQSINNTGLNISVQSGDTFRIFIRVLNSQTPNTTIYPQLEKGSKANSYSEYGKEPIWLGEIGDYQDYIYPSNDRWFLHKEIGKVVLDGSESGLSYSNNVLFFVTDNYLKNSEGGICYTSHFKGTANGGGVNTNLNAWCGNASTIAMMDTTKTSLAIWKTWLESNNVVGLYILKTPTDTEITDTTLLEQLNNLMTLPLYKNMTHITLTPNDLQPTMKIEYYRDTSINENFVPKEDMTKYYTKTETNAQIQISSSDIMSEVSRVEEKTDANNKYTGRVETSVTNLQTDTRTLLTFKQNVEQNGVETLKNTLIQADINGLSITKGESFNTQITDRTLEVNSNNKELIFLGYDNDLKKTVARMDWIESEHATIGVHRTETITKNGQKRTAGFYVGGGN